jgi:hypothetical protein
LSITLELKINRIVKPNVFFTIQGYYSAKPGPESNLPLGEIFGVQN